MPSWAYDVLPEHVYEAHYWWGVWQEAERMRRLGLSSEDQVKRYGHACIPEKYHGIVRREQSPIERYLSPANDMMALHVYMMTYEIAQLARIAELSRWADDGGPL
jgi:hypothetical protein